MHAHLQDSTLCDNWGDWAHSLVSAGSKPFEEKAQTLPPKDNSASVVPSREITIVLPGPAMPREPTVAPPELPQMADFVVSQIPLGLDDKLHKESLTDEAAPTTLQAWLSLVPSIFPQNLSQSKWETLLENKMIAGAWHEAQKAQGGRQVCHQFC